MSNPTPNYVMAMTISRTGSIPSKRTIAAFTFILVVFSILIALLFFPLDFHLYRFPPTTRSTLYSIPFPRHILLILSPLLYHTILKPYYLSPLTPIPTIISYPPFFSLTTLLHHEIGIPQRRWHATHGSIIRFFTLFGRSRISITDDAALKHVLVHNAYNYKKPESLRRLLSSVLGEKGVLTVEDEVVHRRLRKGMARAFSSGAVKELEEGIWDIAKGLEGAWRSLLLGEQGKMVRDDGDGEGEGEEGVVIEVLDWCSRATMDIIGKVGFGVDFHSINHPNEPLREAYRTIFKLDRGSQIAVLLRTVFPRFGQYIPTKTNLAIEKALKVITCKATTIVKEKMMDGVGGAGAGAGGKDILSLIMQENLAVREREHEHDTDTQTLQSLRDQVMTFLGAGHDTTATGVGWTMFLLAKHPHVQSRLRAEIHQHMNDVLGAERGNPSNTTKHLGKHLEVDRLPFLDNVIRESFRYISPVPAMAKQAIADDTLCGYHIPAGTIVEITANVLHRLPEYWGSTADAFDPDRWDRPEARVPNAYMAFSHGARSCLGRKLAETEVKVMLCVLLNAFRFGLVDGAEDPEKNKVSRVTLRPKGGIFLTVSLLEKS